MIGRGIIPPITMTKIFLKRAHLIKILQKKDIGHPKIEIRTHVFSLVKVGSYLLNTTFFKMIDIASRLEA